VFYCKELRKTLREWKKLSRNGMIEWEEEGEGSAEGASEIEINGQDVCCEFCLLLAEKRWKKGVMKFGKERTMEVVELEDLVNEIELGGATLEVMEEDGWFELESQGQKCGFRASSEGLKDEWAHKLAGAVAFEGNHLGDRVLFWFEGLLFVKISPSVQSQLCFCRIVLDSSGVRLKCLKYGPVDLLKADLSDISKVQMMTDVPEAASKLLDEIENNCDYEGMHLTFANQMETCIIMEKRAQFWDLLQEHQRKNYESMHPRRTRSPSSSSGLEIVSNEKINELRMKVSFAAEESSKIEDRRLKELARALVGFADNADINSLPTVSLAARAINLVQRNEHNLECVTDELLEIATNVANMQRERQREGVALALAQVTIDFTREATRAVLMSKLEIDLHGLEIQRDEELQTCGPGSLGRERESFQNEASLHDDTIASIIANVRQKSAIEMKKEGKELNAPPSMEVELKRSLVPEKPRVKKEQRKPFVMRHSRDPRWRNVTGWIDEKTRALKYFVNDSIKFLPIKTATIGALGEVEEEGWSLFAITLSFASGDWVALGFTREVEMKDFEEKLRKLCRRPRKPVLASKKINSGLRLVSASKRATHRAQITLSDARSDAESLETAQGRELESESKEIILEQSTRKIHSALSSTAMQIEQKWCTISRFGTGLDEVSLKISWKEGHLWLRIASNEKTEEIPLDGRTKFFPGAPTATLLNAVVATARKDGKRDWADDRIAEDTFRCALIVESGFGAGKRRVEMLAPSEQDRRNFIHTIHRFLQEGDLA